MNGPGSYLSNLLLSLPSVQIQIHLIKRGGDLYLYQGLQNVHVLSSVFLQDNLQASVESQSIT